jgi:hypothetical protein
MLKQPPKKAAKTAAQKPRRGVARLISRFLSGSATGNVIRTSRATLTWIKPTFRGRANVATGEDGRKRLVSPVS